MIIISGGSYNYFYENRPGEAIEQRKQVDQMIQSIESGHAGSDLTDLEKRFVLGFLREKRDALKVCELTVQTIMDNARDLFRRIEWVDSYDSSPGSIKNWAHENFKLEEAQMKHTKECEDCGGTIEFEHDPDLVFDVEKPDDDVYYCEECK